MKGSQIFQASDLAKRRSELLDEARHGFARIRDRDGMGLVMMPEGQYEVEKQLASWARQFVMIFAAAEKPAEARTGFDFAECAWLKVFDDEDLGTFIRETSEAFLSSYSTMSLQPLDEVVNAWRVTAVALEDESRRSVLLGPVSAEDVEEILRPVDEARESAT